MSLIPSLLWDWDLADDPLEDAFASGLYPEHFRQRRLRREPGSLNSSLWPTIYQQRPWVAPKRVKQLAKPNIGKDGFQVCMDVQHFQPNEITVKTVDDAVVVEGKHEEKEDEHGHIYRHFVRRYQLPKEVDVEDVHSTISSDGVLTIEAAPKKSIGSNERVIQIQQTGPARLTVKSNEKEAGDKMSE